MWKEYRTLLPYLRKYRGRYAIGLAILCAVDAAQLLIPQFIKKAVNLISSGIFNLEEILTIALEIAAVAGFISLGRFFWRFFIHGSSRRIETEMRDRLFAHLLSLSSSFFQKNKTGDLMARATNDMSAIRQAAGMGFVAFIDGVFMSVAILTIMIVQSPSLALFCVAPLPVITILIIVFGNLVGKKFMRVQDVFSKMSDIVQETISGIRIVKTFVRESHFERLFGEANLDYRKANMSLVKVFGLFFPLINFLAGCTVFILLLQGGKSVILATLSPGDLVAMLAYLEMLIWPMLGAGLTVNHLQRGAASLKRVNEVLHSQPDIRSPANPISAKAEGNIEFRSLSFGYPGAEKNAVSDISLRVKKGSTLGILGRIGSGKSTLLKLLPRISDPPAGTVFLDGKDIREYELSALRKTFGYVPQDTFLFSESVRNNIAFGDPQIPENRLASAAELSTISRDLNEFPDGWETMVGEKGLSLSGGQKQRVAISRAVVMDPAVLVFDDALSSVDTETEEKILKSLLSERKGKTNIIVSHRVSTLKYADSIIVLEKGRIIQKGSPAKLLAEKTGYYAEIARLQQLEMEAESEGKRTAKGRRKAGRPKASS